MVLSRLRRTREPSLFLKTNPKGEVLPHPRGQVHRSPVHGATTPAREAEILNRHKSVAGRQPTPKPRR